MSSNIQSFFIAGMNYKKTDASVRGSFAINQDQYSSILQKAALQGLHEVFIISTCNRTEIYGLADDANVLIDLLCNETAGTKETFIERCYIKQGLQAIEHLFSVAAGLDSQILGDYEIVGQIKLAIKFAKEHHMIGAFTERLFNTVLQSSKAIKTQTQLSGGTVSVSFAAIQFLREHLKNARDKKIVLLGTGKIGRNTCKNLVDYLDTRNITLINRTEDKAKELAEELNLKYAGAHSLNEEIKEADVVIVATNADKPIITERHVAKDRHQILVDLSIPNNVEPICGSLFNITLVNVDGLSKISDITLQKRKAEVPKAEAIIKEHINDFFEWHCMRKHAEVLKSFKQTLQDIHGYCFEELADKEAIQKGVNNLATKMRRRHTPGCNYIQAINEYIEQPVFA
jgi:glutamyl-tRNA reductase